MNGAVDAFDKGHKSHKQTETKVDELYRQIGQLKVERDFSAKGSVIKARSTPGDVSKRVSQADPVTTMRIG